MKLPQVVLNASIVLFFVTGSTPCEGQEKAVVPKMTQTEYERLHADLEPKNEVWKTIPWKTSLVEAQNAALAEGKPIFIWAMDGNPLGCT